MIHLYLALAALLLLAIVGAQDYLVPALQQKSISSGLTGKYHWFLDGAFVLLAAAIFMAFRQGDIIQQVLAYSAAVFLVLTGASGTYTTSLGPKGEQIHSALTAVTFVLAIALQIVSNHSAAMWTITGFAAAAAIATHFLVTNASVTEKVGVLGLCSWLVAWSLTKP